MGPLEVSDLDLNKAYNPAPSAQQTASQAEHPDAVDLTTDASAEGQGGNDEEAAAQTEEELEASLTAARELEAEEENDYFFFFFFFFLACLFCFHCLDAQDSCLTNSRCVVSFGLSGLWWTSHTLEVAIIALV